MFRYYFSNIQFQSHAGSIEAAPLRQGHCSRKMGFNPTLVRLRPGSNTGLRTYFVTCFNPTLVRLRPRLLMATNTTKVSFNPTLVRLRPVEAREVLKQILIGFNPTLVRLRPKLLTYELRLLECFNPTLVRLRPQGVGGPAWGGARVSIPRWFD